MILALGFFGIHQSHYKWFNFADYLKALIIRWGIFSSIFDFVSSSCFSGSWLPSLISSALSDRKLTNSRIGTHYVDLSTYGSTTNFDFPFWIWLEDWADSFQGCNMDWKIVPWQNFCGTQGSQYGYIDP